MDSDQTLNATKVAELLQLYPAHVWRWCMRLGLIRSPGFHNPILLTVREAVAVRVACTLAGRNDARLSRAAADAILNTDSRWLFILPDQYLEGDTADELLDKWKVIGAPTGTVLDTQLLGLRFGGMEQG